MCASTCVCCIERNIKPKSKKWKHYINKTFHWWADGSCVIAFYIFSRVWGYLPECIEIGLGYWKDKSCLVIYNGKTFIKSKDNGYYVILSFFCSDRLNLNKVRYFFRLWYSIHLHFVYKQTLLVYEYQNVHSIEIKCSVSGWLVVYVYIIEVKTIFLFNFLSD